MTIDEAIKICEEDAEKIGGNPQSDRHAERCRQLAEWLTDYKELKNSIGAAKLSNMKEALELIRAYKTENATLREENKVLISECDRLIKEKGELLSKVSGGDVLRICQLEEQLEKAKRLLKAAVEDIHSRDYCHGCIYESSEGKEQYLNCEYHNCFKWRYADEALKLIES